MKHYLCTLTAFLILALPMVSSADDTEIYGTQSVGVQPNVMIILDNSGSMKNNKDVGGEDYDPAKDYTATAVAAGNTAVTKNAVYKKVETFNYFTWKINITWELYKDDVSNIQCTRVTDKLNTDGYASRARLNTDTTCGGSRSDYRLGNFINYENSGLEAEYRYVVAKRAIIKLLSETTDKRFGLMHFNSSQGGYVKYPCGTDNATISTYIESMDSGDFSTWTPLAETLTEAGLYFAGQSSWFNSGVSYTSPIEEPCQKNYVILMTDGTPTEDDDYRLSSWDYIISGEKIATSDVPNSNEPTPAESLLDDVSKFLYAHDISSLGDGTSLAKQNVITYTIGLQTEQLLLSETAKNGGGSYFYASTVSGLDEALASINNSISETNAVFLAPSVPVNRSTRTEQSDWLYLAFFRPQSSGEWLGNIKKYAIGDNGELFGKIPGSDNVIDTSRNVVDEFGTIMQNACSFWTDDCPDGGNATTGGLGEKLILNESADSTEPDIMVNRNVYMLTGTSPDPDITADANIFNSSNTAVTSIAGMDSTLINSVRKLTDSWHFGAIIHSEPAVVHYATDQSVIYVGANDGMIHAFDDTDGSELWAFIPPGQADRLSLITDSEQNFYVDGSPSVSYGDLLSGTDLFQPKDMIIGERRGGYNYYVMDISDYLKPQYKYTIERDILPGYPLGQSWCRPAIGLISSGTAKDATGKIVVDVSKEKEVFFIAGGYDTNQDLETPEENDTMGKAIISVNTGDGSLGSFIASPDSLDMKHCIVDMNTNTTYTDTHGNDITTRVYAGDMAGKVFVFADDILVDSLDGESVVLGNIPTGEFATRFCLFDAGGKKIFYPPESSRIGYSRNEWVVFGTGDRENPLGTGVQNGIYAVKNDWLNSNLTENDLFNTTENLIAQGNKNQADTAAESLATAKGWYVNFYDPGEKLVSRPIIIQDYIYFTTYVPASDTSSDSDADPCAGAGGLGTSYLWSIHLSNGVPINDTDGDTIYEKEERRTQVAVMAQPTVVDATMISTPKTVMIPTSINFKYYFWRQQ